MWKWILAAIAVPVLSLAIATVTVSLTERHVPHGDPAGYEMSRQVDLQYEAIPLVRLLTNPERYDGQKVRVAGYVTLEFEGSGVYPDKTAYQAGLTRNAVWVDPPDSMRPKRGSSVFRRYGEVAGIFTAGEHGHMGLFSGALTQVRSVSPTYTRTQFEKDRPKTQTAVIVQALASGRFLMLVGWCVLGMLWVWRRNSASSP